ncbi:ABC transporter ATP-binding protein [Pseudaquabacterium rugosum]|uniref:ATP-binding cassette domain-containing protein n=1 Tax=Pseudaquabacterium rugosum TaxID=2984194 RepID=A0ABU9BB07_9BURK
MLRIENLVLARGGKRVLHGVDLVARPGEITALVGANGAGKSSLVMAVAGALPLDSGQVTVDGQPLAGLSPDRVRALGVAVVPEGHRLLGELSVLDNLRVGATQRPAAEVRGAIDEVLERLPELKAKLDAPGRALSGGQKQMVAVAQALLCRPRYLIVDELSLGLAPLVVKRLAGLLQEVAAAGTGVLLIEQFTTLALSISRQAGVMVRGRMAWAGASQDLIDQPAILTRSYLGS